MAKTCKLCGNNLLSTGRNRGGRAFCAPCCTAQGICTRCYSRPQDRPGFKVCIRCHEFDVIRKNDMLERTGRRHGWAKWEVEQIERDREFAAQLVEKHKEDLANANGL